MFRKMRIAVLLYVLLLVGGGAWVTSERSTDWSVPLYVLVYPINADGSEAARRYIDNLDIETFAPVQQFFVDEAERFGVGVGRPFVVSLAAPVNELPPAPPVERNVLGVMAWSLRLRFWAWRVEANQEKPAADVQVFVAYHDGEQRKTLPHSLGLEKGLIGVVHAFASRRMTQANNVVIAHEMLHTVGASDKYDPRTAYPRFPDGFAAPNQRPRFPQKRAEVMGGRIPVNETSAGIPRSLKQVTVGKRTAEEIGWLRESS